MDLGVIAADHELELFDAARTQPIFRSTHDLSPVALEAMVRVDGHVIDPAAMAVMADQHRGGEGAVGSAQQYRCVGLFARQRNIGGRIVPRPRRSATLPQRNHLGDIAVFNGPDGQGVMGGFGIHSTLPGFMMPCGSSIALSERISSIATLSLTSGSSSRLSTPMPCSAEIDPPIRSTISNTTALTSCHLPRKSAVSPPTGWLML